MKINFILLTMLLLVASTSKAQSKSLSESSAASIKASTETSLESFSIAPEYINASAAEYEMTAGTNPLGLELVSDPGENSYLMRLSRSCDEAHDASYFNSNTDNLCLNTALQQPLAEGGEIRLQLLRTSIPEIVVLLNGKKIAQFELEESDVDVLAQIAAGRRKSWIGGATPTGHGVLTLTDLEMEEDVTFPEAVAKGTMGVVATAGGLIPSAAQYNARKLMSRNILRRRINEMLNEELSGSVRQVSWTVIVPLIEALQVLDGLPAY